MPQHPRPGRGLLGVEYAEFGFLGPGWSNFCARITATAATVARVSRAGPWLVAALLVHRVGLAFDGAHQGEIRREDEPLADSRALRTRRRVIALVDGKQCAKVTALGAGEIVNWHGVDRLEDLGEIESGRDALGGSVRIWHDVKIEDFRR